MRLLAAFCGASRVVLTDVKAIVNVAQENLSMFVEHGILDANANVSCECFEWQNSDASEPGRYDAIFASDCLYDTTYYADLVRI